MHDLVIHLFSLNLLAAAVTPPTSSNQTIRVAIVTTLGVVVAAAITAAASTYQRRSTPPVVPPTPEPAPSPVNTGDNYTREYFNSLVRDQRELNKIRQRYAHLREACLERSLDPDVLIREQEQRT